MSIPIQQRTDFECWKSLGPIIQSRLARRFVTLCCAVCMLQAVGCSQSNAPSAASSTDPLVVESTDDFAYDTPMITEGLTTPPVHPATTAPLGDETEVIGVLVNDEARAYVVTAMHSYGTHVINDLIDSCPVTVTYCDQTDVARVLTLTGKESPLDIQVGGWMQGEMQVMTGDRMYGQSSPDVPFEDLPFERTTWGQWKQAHPDTRVFTGQAPDSENETDSSSSSEPETAN